MQTSFVKVPKYNYLYMQYIVISNIVIKHEYVIYIYVCVYIYISLQLSHIVSHISYLDHLTEAAALKNASAFQVAEASNMYVS